MTSPLDALRSRSGDGGPRTSVRRVALADTIAEDLTAAILTGEIPQGTFLRESELALRYPVSRQSLRAALIQLQHTGLLRREMNRGFWVPHLTPADVEDLYDMKVMIDAAAARRVASHPDRLSAAVAVLDRIEQFKPSVSGPDVVRAHFDFHRAVTAAAENPWLLRFSDLLFPATWLSLGRATWNSPFIRAASVVNHHRRLLDDLRSGDIERAVRAAVEHSEAARPTVLGSVGQQQPPSAGTATSADTERS